MIVLIFHPDHLILVRIKHHKGRTLQGGLLHTAVPHARCVRFATIFSVQKAVFILEILSALLVSDESDGRMIIFGCGKEKTELQLQNTVILRIKIRKNLKFFAGNKGSELKCGSEYFLYFVHLKVQKLKDNVQTNELLTTMCIIYHFLSINLFSVKKVPRNKKFLLMI
jgi:hypothetical protein